MLRVWAERSVPDSDIGPLACHLLDGSPRLPPSSVAHVCPVYLHEADDPHEYLGVEGCEARVASWLLQLGAHMTRKGMLLSPGKRIRATRLAVQIPGRCSCWGNL
jgi:hypothetical protein